jgi:formylglycine-generating enzyme required for sulfatase activity
MKIFISYRRAESTYLIGRIKDRLLAAFGAGSVFRDLDDIPSGVDFRTVLEKETQECNVMLVIIGPKWAEIAYEDGTKRLFDPKDYTRIEVETGLKRRQEKKTVVVPVLILGAPMPLSKNLPESLAQLTYQNAKAVRDDPDFHNDMERLIRDIRLVQGYAEDDIATADFEPKTIYIGEGPFWMGSDPGEGIPDYETPLHPINLPAYRVGKYPVKNTEYAVFIYETERPAPRSKSWEGKEIRAGMGDHPVTDVTWQDALDYCAWLSRTTGRNYGLPNEAQWEKACRAGGTSRYPWGDEFDPARSNHGGAQLAPVNASPAQNEYGLFDLLGNVCQWTTTLWGRKLPAPDDEYKYPWGADRRNDLSASRYIRRVIRGTSFAEKIETLRCSTRRGQLPDDPAWDGAGIGFRVVMTVDQAR